MIRERKCRKMLNFVEGGFGIDVGDFLQERQRARDLSGATEPESPESCSPSPLNSLQALRVDLAVVLGSLREQLTIFERPVALRVVRVPAALLLRRGAADALLDGIESACEERNVREFEIETGEGQECAAAAEGCDAARARHALLEALRPRAWPNMASLVRPGSENREA